MWLAVGRLEAAKAYPTFLRAMAQLCGGNRILLICGQGSLRGELVLKKWVQLYGELLAGSKGNL